MRLHIGRRRSRQAATAAASGADATDAYRLLLKQMLDVCHRAAGGDLEARVPLVPGVESDEMVSLRNELNRVLDRIDMFVRESRGSLQAAREGRLYREFLAGGMTGAFRVAAAEVDGARKTMAGYAEQTAAAGRVRQKLAGDFETTVASVAEQIASSATELSASAAGLAQAATSAVGEADQARETVSTLEDRSKEIAQVVTVISKVAAQTKLLALNANIEAARAGSAGNGFAVVASEVKELAEQTERATSDIIELIRSVQGVAVESSAVMGSIGDTVREMSSLTHGVAIAVDGSHGAQDTSGSYSGLAEMTELLRCESDRFLVAIRDV